MNQLDEDIKHLEECRELNERILSYMKELRLFRMREILNIKTELNSVESQSLSNKTEIEEYNRLITLRQMMNTENSRR